MRYEVPLRAPANMTQSLVAGTDFKESNNNLAFGGVPVISNTYADTAQFVLGYQATYTDPYGSTTIHRHQTCPLISTPATTHQLAPPRTIRNTTPPSPVLA